MKTPGRKYPLIYAVVLLALVSLAPSTPVADLADSRLAPSAASFTPTDCAECQGGVTQLTLQYNGTASATVVVQDSDETYFNATVNPGEQFTFNGTKSDGKFQKNNLDIVVDGAVVATVHVSCSQPIGPGLIIGDFEIIEAVSKDGGLVCPIPPSPPCVACGFGVDNANKVSELSFVYNGADGATVTVRNGKKDDGDILFTGTLNHGDTFTVKASDIGDTKLKSSITFYDGADNEIASLHTSCSKPLGPGTLAGDFEVTAGLDEDGVPLCTPPPPPTCLECGFGADNANKVSELSFVYNGTDGATITVRNGKKDDGDILFTVTLNNGDTFTVRASDIGETKFKSSITFYNGAGDEIASLHTSCSKPLGPGTVAGDFEVTAGLDKDGVPLCAAPPPPDCLECKGGVIELTLQYNGAVAVTVVVQDSEDTYFNATVNPGESFTFNGTKSDGKFQKNDLDVLVDGSVVSTIHVSCSKPIGPGLTFGDFVILEAISKDNGKVCPVCLGITTSDLPTWDGNIVSNGDGTGSIVIQAPLGLKRITLGTPSSNLALIEVRNGSGDVLEFTGTDAINGTEHSGFNQLDFTGKIYEAPVEATLIVAAPEAGGSSFFLHFSDCCSNTLRVDPALDLFVTSVGTESATETPGTFALRPNYPNPFGARTTVRFELPETTTVRLVIYDMMGREVRTLVREQVGAGVRQETWDGRNNAGQRVSSGVYFYRLEAGSFVQTRQMTLIK